MTEQEAAFKSMVGHYSLDIQGMHKPLFFLWHAEGEVSSPRWPSTDIVFDLCDAKAGQFCTHVVQVQVMEQDGQHFIVSSVFVQIFVMENTMNGDFIA